MSRSLVLISLVVAVLAWGSAADKQCPEEVILSLYELGPKMEVLGAWRNKVYTDATVTCAVKDERCLYKTNSDDQGVELVVESLIWKRNQGCDTIVSGKFSFNPLASKGQIAVIIALALSAAAVVAVFFGCLAYFAPPESFWGRILMKNQQRNPRDTSPPRSPEEEMIERPQMALRVEAERAGQ